MANIELYKVRVEDDTGKKAFYPHTSTDIVFDSAGKNVDTLLKEKANLSHTHDDRYYTETEMNTKLNAKLDTTGNASNVTNAFTQSSSLSNLTTGEKLSISLGKIMKAIADLISHIGNKSNPHAVTKSQVGLGNVTNDSQVKRSEMGVANGVATLDTTGKVPSSQLPSYVDDVLDYTNKASFPSKGETGKIYVDDSTNKTYRWSSTAYVEISSSLALGETSSTAYAGNKGKETTDNVNAILAGTKVVPKATDANTLDGKDSTSFALVTHNHNTLYSKILDGSNGLFNGNMTPQPNLLINSDFRSGIINQKGQTSYSPPNESYQYTIDLWRQACRPANAMKTSVLSDYIKVEMLGTSTGDAFFEQKLDKTIKEQCILTFKVKSVVGSVRIGLMGESNNNNLMTITKAGLYHVTHTNVISAMVYFTQKNTSVEIEYMKLEKGSFFTGMPVWDKGLELLKCLQYATVIKAYTGVYTGRLDGTRCTFLIPYPVKMKNKPTINLTNLRVFYGATNTEVINTPSDVTIDSHSTHLVISFLSKIAGSHCTVTLFSTTYIDSNIY